MWHACTGTSTETHPAEPFAPAARLTAAERAARGRKARARTPRSSHSAFDPKADRDPLGLLESQNRSRVPELVPIRHTRMAASPLAFFRGAATIMAHDLHATPTSGLSVQLSGDAHLLNFGGFASPERARVFDLNDFDETLRGPFEWDVKRLAASFEIAGRQSDFSRNERRKAVRTVVRAYRRAMRRFARMHELDVWYARLDVQDLSQQLGQRNEADLDRELRLAAKRARAHDHLAALARLTHEVDGVPKIVSDPPLVVPVGELAGGDDLEARIRLIFLGYVLTLPDDRRALIDRFGYGDLARKAVGIGSIGTRCWLLLLLGLDNADPLFLQIKEAQASVLEPSLGRSPYPSHGQRVVSGQHLMQAASDIFLGWTHSHHEPDGFARDYYIRQLWDRKVSVDVERLRPRALVGYARACGWTLARAHARSGDRVAIAAYLGSGDAFDQAVGEFADVYADLNERDFHSFTSRG